LTVPVVDVGPPVTPLQQDEGYRKHEHRKLEDQADGQYKLLAPPSKPLDDAIAERLPASPAATRPRRRAD